MVKRWFYGNNIFWENKKPAEDVGIITIPKDSIRFDTVQNLPYRVRNYFTVGINMSSKKHNWHFSSPEYRHWQDNIETYVKSVWLSRDFINEGKLRNPVGLHWSPDDKKWVIHPGGSRQVILYHYYGNKITGIGFNTCGKKVNFEKKFYSVEEIKEYCNVSNIHLSIVEQYNTLVPHIHLDSHTIQENVHKMHKRIKKFYKTTKIISNFKLEEYGYVPPKDEDVLKTIKVTIEDKNIDTIMKAFMLIPSFDNFENYGVKVERT